MTYQYYFLRYIQEYIEAFIAYGILSYLKNDKFILKEVIKYSFVIGAITFILEEYNPAYTKALKGGVIMTAASQALSKTA